ncbi:MAG TPA: YbdD/YjiX family protein [Terriglobia bacterium]|nr:YbdD/YjiX family protein [Terriglobia bacterium]
MPAVANLLRTFWNYLREVSGELDYARYRARMASEGSDPVSRREFYDQRQREKYSRPNRCC